MNSYFVLIGTSYGHGGTAIDSRVIAVCSTSEGAARLREICAARLLDHQYFERVNDESFRSQSYSISLRISGIDEFDPSLHTVMSISGGIPVLFGQYETTPDFIGQYPLLKVYQPANASNNPGQ